MLVYASKLIGKPIMSLQTGTAIAWVDSIYINPDNLKIIAFDLTGPALKGSNERFLETKSVREYSEYGLIVDSQDDFFDLIDVEKVRKVVDLDFSVIGLKVISRKKSHLGKVIDYTVTSDNFELQQLIVKRPAWKSLMDAELLIPRKEIVEVNNKSIIVKDDEKTIRERAMNEDFVPNFVNPFRKNPNQTEPGYAPAQSQNPDEQDTE